MEEVADDKLDPESSEAPEDVPPPPKLERQKCDTEREGAVCWLRSLDEPPYIQVTA